MSEKTASGALGALRGGDSRVARQRPSTLSHSRAPSAWRTLAVLTLIAAAFGGLVLLTLLDVFRDRATQNARDATTAMAEMVDGWFSRYAPLPKLLARDPRVVAAMAEGADPADLGWLNAELAIWNETTQTSDIYLMATDGTTVAASNAGTEVSFVGSNFSFRPYFQEAMAGETGRLFALGTTSGLRGYYFSAPVRAGEAVVGVAVVKISIEPLETALENAPHVTFVTDETGVIIISDIKDLRLTAFGPLTPRAQAEIARTRRFDLERMPLAPIAAAGDWGAGRPVVRAPSKEVDQAPRSALHLSDPLTQNP